MTQTAHAFDPSILREYDIRGIVGDTLHAPDAFAIGRSFGQVVASGGGRTVAVGYDGRLASPERAAPLVTGLRAGGMAVRRGGGGPTPGVDSPAAAREPDDARPPQRVGTGDRRAGPEPSARRA